jgi:hypothetical protein
VQYNLSSQVFVPYFFDMINMINMIDMILYSLAFSYGIMKYPDLPTHLTK